MDIAHFKEIVRYSHQNQRTMEGKVKDLYARIGMDYERELLDVMQVVRPLFREKSYIVIELPLADHEIGALCYKGESFGYTLLNSSLPYVNVNFALCHETYHILFQEELADNKLELYMNEHYFDYEEEYAVNLFAGMLLMPERSYRMMFQKFTWDTLEGDTEVSVVVRLMGYFKVPYMAALVRCYELGLFKAGETLETLMKVDEGCIRREFRRLWMDEAILCPTRKDDFEFLKSAVISFGMEYAEDGLISERTVKKAVQNMTRIYCEVRGE